MSLLSVKNLTFSYEGSYQTIFENVSFDLDTNWKLGFIGRNGRGKTTFLRLLMGDFPYQGTITHSVEFDYFPFPIPHPQRPTLEIARELIAPFGEMEREMEACLSAGDPPSLERYGELLDQYLYYDGYGINDRIQRELASLQVGDPILERPFSTLSQGEQTKVLLAALFLKPNRFLLIDEPTNHLDLLGRQVVGDYLSGKKGFILVSHDRAFLDRIVDHVLSINRTDIQVQRGNYTTWKENKDREDAREQLENKKLEQEIAGLTAAANQAAGVSVRMSRGEGGSIDRDLKGHRSAKVMRRAKVMEARTQRMIQEKRELLKNIEEADSLKLHPEKFYRPRLLEGYQLSPQYGDTPLFSPLTFQVEQGDRIALLGPNGSGKSTLLHLILGENISYKGNLLIGSGLSISTVPQRTDFLQGDLTQFALDNGLDESLFKAILRKLDFTRSLFDQKLESLSAGQKKKVLLAKSLSQHAHLYVWDEPLNYIDVLSRVQIEELILKYRPTMLFVEHDAVFCQKVATKTLVLQPLVR